MTLQGGGADPNSYMSTVIHLERGLNQQRLQDDPSVENITRAHEAFNRIDELQKAIDGEIQQSNDYELIAREALRTMGPPPLEGNFLPEDLRTAMAKVMQEQIPIPQWHEAGASDLNHGQVAAGLGFAIGQLLRGRGLKSAMPALTAPIEMAQERVDKKYQTDLTSANLQRQDRDFRARSLQEQIQTGLQRYQTARGSYDREVGDRMKMTQQGHLDSARIYQARIGQLNQEQQKAWDAYLKNPSEGTAGRLRGLDPSYAPSPDQVQKDSQQLRSKNLIMANHDWRETLKPYVNEFGEVDDVNRAELEKKRAAFASATGVNVDELDPIPTGETVKKQAQAERVHEFSEKLHVDQDKVKLGQDRLAAQKSRWAGELGIKRGNLDVAKKRLQVAWQNAVTARTNAQTGQAQYSLQQYKAELERFKLEQEAFNKSAQQKLHEKKNGLADQAAEARAYANSLAGQKFADPQKVATAKAKADGLDSEVNFLTSQLEPDVTLPNPESVFGLGQPTQIPNPNYVGGGAIQPVIPPSYSGPNPAMAGPIEMRSTGGGMPQLPAVAPGGDAGFEGKTIKVGGWTIGKAKRGGGKGKR